MSKIGVSIKLNVSEIDKARLFKGQKGVYLDATVFIDLDQLDQYGNSGMITQDITKEEKQQGVRGNILGNCKVFWSDSGQAPNQQEPQQQQQQYQQPQQPETPPPGYNHNTQGVNQPQNSVLQPEDFDGDIPF